MASEPSVGQPFGMGLRFSLGDPSPTATVGLPAYQGVTIGAVGDVAPPIVVSQAASPNIKLTTYMRAADDFGGGWLQPRIMGPPAATVDHDITNAQTGAVVGTFSGGAIAAMGTPPSGAGTPAAGETVEWYSATSGNIPTGATGLGGVGIYHILTHVNGSGGNSDKLAVFKDDTYIMVTP